MNGRNLIVERVAAVLVTASLLLTGCGRGEARVESEARSSSQAPVPASERPGAIADTPALAGASDGPADERVADPHQPVEHVVEPTATGAPGAAAPGPRAVPEPRRAGPKEAASASVTVPEPRSPSSQQASPEEILRATSRAYQGLRSLRAEFEQTLENTLLGRTTRSAGTVYQRQPDRFLMAFSDPEDDLIVSDGEYFWMYFPSVDPKQVLRTARGSQGLDLHAQFIGDPVRRFETTYHGTETVRGRRTHVMTLVPREPLGYRRLKVWIDAEDHLVRRFELTESNDNIRHFALRDLVKNPSLPDTLFAFTPPPGAQVVTR